MKVCADREMRRISRPLDVTVIDWSAENHVNFCC